MDDKNIVNDGVQEYSNKYSLSKLDHDLYHEDLDISNPVYRVKRVGMPNKGCKWKIMLNEKVLFIIEGIKLSKQEKEYLDTVDGFAFMLRQAKSGIKSFNNFKLELHKLIPKAARGRPKSKK